MPQSALLAGLLLCANCCQPMIPTYTLKSGRRYRYYVCKSVRQKNWNACPTKSVPARMIEDSVVEQLRVALANPETRDGLQVPGTDSEVFECDPFELVRAVLKSVTFNGETGAVLLDLKCQG